MNNRFALIPLALVLVVATAAASSPPALFAPESVPMSINVLSPAFGPDGNDVYYTEANADYSVIVHAARNGGQWTAPQVAPFSGRWRDLEPAMSPDGTFLVFASNRPANGGSMPLTGHYNGQSFPAAGGNLWLVRREGSGWSAPQRLPETINANDAVFSPSIVGDGSLYFMRATGSAGRFALYRSAYERGSYQSAELAPFNDLDYGSFDPAVARDESFAIFSSTRPPVRKGGNDLFIAFRRNGTWTNPVDLTSLIGASGGDIEARLSPDNRRLYYSSRALLPTNYPVDPAFASTLAWNNGLAHIWTVDLTPFLAGP
jgi:hypothetical protein